MKELKYQLRYTFSTEEQASIFKKQISQSERRIHLMNDIPMIETNDLTKALTIDPEKVIGYVESVEQYEDIPECLIINFKILEHQKDYLGLP